nr:PREDICTED: protein OSCP1 [Bemisia tabaci]
MFDHSLPLLFLNLGGEMMYIIDQRLKAQEVDVEKAKTVLNDIGKIMLNQRCLDELFKPQEVYNRQALKTLFHDLAHASIMRLNEISMDKLFDLMIMVFKYQLVQCSKPQDLLLITLNHLDSIRYLLTTPFCHKQLDVTYFMLIKTYSQVTSGDLQNIRFHLLSFFQDIRIRVSLFLRQGLQNNDGGFIISTNYTLPYEYEVPGSIRLYNSEGCICDLLNFSPGGKYTQAPEPSSLELRGKRCTTLGTNVYSAIKPHKKEDENFWSTCDSVSSEQWHFTDTDCGLREELNLLIKQLGNRQDTQGEGSLSSVTTFNLFEEDTDPTRLVQSIRFPIFVGL